jgi:hypothetical protein
MQEKAYEGVMIDHCPRCGGTWLDSGEISRVIDTHEKTFTHAEKIDAFEEKGRDAGKNKEIRCPQCNALMPSFHYMVNTGVFLNRCPQRHGLWLDKGELERVQIVMEEYDQRFAPAKPAAGTGGDISDPEMLSAIKGCPRCGEMLHEERYESEKLDFCPRCGGVWCDGAELRKILESREQTFSATQQKAIAADEKSAAQVSEKELLSELGCVICGAPLRRINFSQTSSILIDTCPHGHGVWLDKDELEGVQIFIEKWEGQRDRVRSDYGPVLKQVRTNTQHKHRKAVDSTRVSRYGFVNRMIHALARKGIFR